MARPDDTAAASASPGKVETLILGACGGACPSLCRIAVSLLAHPGDSPAKELGASALIGIGILSVLGAIVAYVWHETDRKKIFSVGIGLPALFMCGASGVNPPSQGQTISSSTFWNQFSFRVYAQAPAALQPARELMLDLPSAVQGDLVVATFRTSSGGLTSTTVSTGTIVPIPQGTVSVTLSSKNADSDPIPMPNDTSFVRIRITAQKRSLYGLWFAIGVNTKPYMLNANIYHFQQVSGTATDVGVGANGSVFVIGKAPCDANGCGIYRFDGTTFQQIEGSAVRIAVDPSGNPWVVNRSGGIFRLVGGHFQQVPGTATDVGVGANGSVFVIGTAPCDANGCGIYRFDGTTFQQIEGSAVRIAVDPSGNPWVVNRSGGIFRLVGAHFQQVPGAASDVGAGANGSVFIIGTAPCDANGCGIYRFDGTAFRQIEGSAVGIAVDPSGNPWVVNRQQGIFRMM